MIASTSQVSVETCDEQISKENDHLKREVKKLELEVNKLKKQDKCNLLKIIIIIW
jgi:cell division protein FtsB